ncbi:MAG: amidohydrolase family protein, partial [Bacteroidales bacterium]|nr:amidohydrolase family protein [Bacteroidales bacterium]
MDSLPPRIDTHIHLYDTRREGSSTFLDPVKHGKIYFPHFARQFVDTAGPAGVSYAVVVEASQRREDNFWLLQHVDTSEALVAFIGNLDPRDPYYARDLDSLSKSPKFRGIRIRPTTPINMGDPQIIKSLVELSRRNLVLELGGNGIDPAVVAGIARRYPNMNIIMNHLAGGSMQGDQIIPADWKARLAVFASEPNVYCKISALYTLSGKNPAPVNPEFYDQLIDPVVDAFGPDRVLYGSNWTLSDMLGSYENLILILDDYCNRREGLSAGQLFFENANRAYGINREKVEYPGNGNGLFRTFWEGDLGGREWFTDSLCGEIVPMVDESWGSESPGCGVRNTFWNARWTGYLEPVFSGMHTFYLTISDFGRVWINDELIIDKWFGGAGNACYTGSIDLNSLEQVPVKIEYANLLDEAFIRLEWECEELPREVIPVHQLYVPVNTVVQEKRHSKSFNVYPNPAKNDITISGNSYCLDEIQIVDICGKMIYQRKVNTSDLKVDVSSWSAGLYFIENIFEDGRAF